MRMSWLKGSTGLQSPDQFPLLRHGEEVIIAVLKHSTVPSTALPGMTLEQNPSIDCGWKTWRRARRGMACTAISPTEHADYVWCLLWPCPG